MVLVRAMAGTAGVVTIQGDSPRWNEINASVWEHERAGLQHIKSLLPDADPYLAWANVEFVAPDGSVSEVDLLVLANRKAKRLADLLHHYVPQPGRQIKCRTSAR